MIPRKKHATVATILILIIFAILVASFLLREEESEIQILDTLQLTAQNIEMTVSVSGETNEVRQERAGAQLLEHFTEVGTGG